MPPSRLRVLSSIDTVGVNVVVRWSESISSGAADCIRKQVRSWQYDSRLRVIHLVVANFIQLPQGISPRPLQLIRRSFGIGQVEHRFPPGCEIAHRQ